MISLNLFRQENDLSFHAFGVIWACTIFKKLFPSCFAYFFLIFFFCHVLLYFVMFFPTMPFSRRLFLAFCWYSIQSTPRAFLLVIIFGQWFLLDFYVDESNDSFISSFHCLYILFFSILNSFTHSPVQCWLASVIVGVLIIILLWKCF